MACFVGRIGESPLSLELRGFRLRRGWRPTISGRRQIRAAAALSGARALVVAVRGRLLGAGRHRRLAGRARGRLAAGRRRAEEQLGGRQMGAVGGLGVGIYKALHGGGSRGRVALGEDALEVGGGLAAKDAVEEGDQVAVVGAAEVDAVDDVDRLGVARLLAHQDVFLQNVCERKHDSIR